MPEDHAVTVVADEPRTLIGAIVQLARDPTVDVTKLDALVQMQERMERRQAEIEFSQALGRLAVQMPRVKKNGRVTLIRKDGTDGGTYPFAKWEDIDKIIRPLMAAEGFSLSFDSQMRSAEGGGLIVTGTLLHRDGHSKSASMPLALDAGPGRNNLQAMGSTLSYGKRYCAEMLLNIVREGDDDDGRGAAGAEPINAENVKRLADLIAETKSDPKAFLKFMNVAGLSEILVRDYPTALNALLAKKAKVAT